MHSINKKKISKERKILEVRKITKKNLRGAALSFVNLAVHIYNDSNQKLSRKVVQI